jgi:hypothetical protein
MVAYTIVAAFDDYSRARSAIREIEASESALAGISLVANNAGNRYGTVPQPRGGAGSGALAAIDTAVIPGIGPAVTAGPAAAALARGAGLPDALVGIGLPREAAELYAEAVRRGASLVAVRVESKDRDRVSDILEACGPMDLERRRAEWQQEGWQRFDERGAPHPGPYYGSATTTSGAPADHGIAPVVLPESGPPPAPRGDRGEAARGPQTGGWTIRREGPVGADWNEPRVRSYPAIPTPREDPGSAARGSQEEETSGRRS